MGAAQSGKRSAARPASRRRAVTSEGTLLNPPVKVNALGIFPRSAGGGVQVARKNLRIQLQEPRGRRGGVARRPSMSALQRGRCFRGIRNPLVLERLPVELLEIEEAHAV